MSHISLSCLQPSTFDGEGDLRKSGAPRHGVSHLPGLRGAEEAMEQLWAELLPQINKRSLPTHTHQPLAPRMVAIPPLPARCCSSSGTYSSGLATLTPYKATTVPKPWPGLRGTAGDAQWSVCDGRGWPFKDLCASVHR